MIRLFIGLIKGLVVGGGAAYAALQLGLYASFWTIIACALIGAVVGLVAGRAPWKAETLWTPAIKMIVGGVIGVGLGAVALYLMPDRSFAVEGIGQLSLHSTVVLGPIVGALFGAFVELDDGGEKEAKEAAEKKQLAGKK